MNYEFEKEQLQNAVSFVGQASDIYDVLEIVFGESETTLICAGEAVKISKTIPHTKELIGSDAMSQALVNATYFRKAIASLTKGSTVVLDVDESSITVKDGKKKYKINVYPQENYPSFKIGFKDETEAANTMTISKKEMTQCIDKTIGWTEAENKLSSRPILKGVNIALDGSKLTFTATDSYRLAQKVIDYHGESSGKVNATVPMSTLKIAKTIEGENVKINIFDRAIQFCGDKYKIQSSLLDGSYPELNGLIPSSFATVLKINKDEFLNAINSASILGTDEYHTVKLNISNKEVMLSSSSMEYGEFSQDLIDCGASFSGKELKIYFSSVYVKIALRCIDGEDLTISFQNNMKPFIFSDGTQGETFLCLPLRANE